MAETKDHKETEILHPRENPELFGHELPLQELQEAASKNRLPHALLLTGPKGVGKATFAYHLARHLLNNQKAGSHTSRLIAQNSHPDLLVVEEGRARIEPKTRKKTIEISVAEAREVESFLAHTPAMGGYRIVIVDSADAMNRSAANALLKILEEPPRRTLLLLISHNPGRLLPTIRSRCRPVALKPLTESQFTEVMRYYVSNAGPETIHSLSLLSGGAPGIGLKMYSADALSQYQSMVRLLSTLPGMDNQDILAFSKEVHAKGKPETWEMTARLLTLLLGRVTRQMVRPQEATSLLPGEKELADILRSLIPPQTLAEEQQNLYRQLNDAGKLNLDKKRVMINVLQRIQELCRKDIP